VSLIPLAAGVGFQLLKLVALSGVWLRILRSALPNSVVRPRDALTPYLAAAGVNALLPGKAGAAVRIILGRRRLPEARYETLAGTLVAESVLSGIPMLVLIGVAGATGVLHSALAGLSLHLPRLPFGGSAPVLIAAGALVIAGAVAAVTARRTRKRVVASLASGRQGMRVLTDRTGLVRALLGQFFVWGLRLASIACFLVAFGLPATPRVLLLVVMVQFLAGLVPVTPSGVGAQQGLLALALVGVAPTAAVLAFGVGMQAAVIAADVLAGGIAVGLGARRVAEAALPGGLSASLPMAAAPAPSPAAAL
jgi:uncharacterized membrane protein YbhN (UPF0104 family)